MLFSDLIFYAEFIEKQKYEDEKNRYVASAFTAWQLGAGDKKTFGEYLRYLGLSEKEIITPEQKKKLSEKAHRIAERIMSMDTKCGGKGGKKKGPRK